MPLSAGLASRPSRPSSPGRLLTTCLLLALCLALLPHCSSRPRKVDFDAPMKKGYMLADAYDKLAYVQERFDKTGRITDPTDRVIVNMVLQNGINTVNNMVDMITVYQSATTFRKDSHDAVLKHIRQRLGFLKENARLNLSQLEACKSFIYEAEVLKHINDMIKYFQEIEQVLQEALDIAAPRES